MKKIISYSLWGDNPKYLIGAIENIKGQQKFYPGWICRFYCHAGVDFSWVNELKSYDVELIFKSEEPTNTFMDSPGMFWRFEVLKDPTIERFIVRDTDSRLTQRERNCTLDWERSGKEFHIIRDHLHHTTRIMGGMWGATKSFIDRFNYDKSLEAFNILSYPNIYATDQEFLARMIYPLITNNVCIHDDWDRYGEGALKVPHFRTTEEFIGESIE